VGNWFDDVTEHILQHLEEYANKFLQPSKLERVGKGFRVNPCPFCGHNDCFTLTEGFNGGNCFSCNESGSLIGIVEKLLRETEARQELAKWSNIKYNFASYSPEKAAEKERFDRFQLMCHKAMEFYQGLMTMEVTAEDKLSSTTLTPAKYMVTVRGHIPGALKEFNVGYSGNQFTRSELRKYLSGEGFEDEEIQHVMKEMIGLPPGYFVFPYYDDKGNLVRINCKIFARYCRGKKRQDGTIDFCDYVSFNLSKHHKELHENKTNHQMYPDNFSRGEKKGVFLITRKDRRKKRIILVEGENDILSTWQALQYMPEHKDKFGVAGIGGNVPEGMFDSDFLRQFDEVYEAMDNDDAGDKYREQLNREMPDVTLRKIEIPRKTEEYKGYKDIDEFFKENPKEFSDKLELFEDLIDQAKRVETKHFRVWRDKKSIHSWFLKNRDMELNYSIDYYDIRKKGFSGTLYVHKHGDLIDKKVGDIEKVKIPGAEEGNRLKSELAHIVTKHYTDVRWANNEPQKSYEELLNIFYRTNRREEVTKQLAWYLFQADNKAYENMVKQAQKLIRSETDVANILREVNGYENQEIDPYGHFHKIQLAESFFPEAGDGYMYFAKFVKDGEIPKRVPCLITNKKEEIRLDLLKRKDNQSLLLINNKYELPMEVEVNTVEVESLSLQHEWVDKWIKDELSDVQLAPSTIIREMESFIRMTFYTSEETYKVLALWMYATYYYSLFRSGFPYLVITGGKGTGKSTLDLIVELLAFNATYAVSTSEPALFRSVSIMGGTFILDEVENLNDSAKVNDSGLAAILKGGYSDNGKVLRINPDTKQPERFTVFGPKVISNINGVEDVINDRCITITTYSASFDNVKDLKDAQDYVVEKRKEIHNITSRAALSALMNFKKVYEIFQTDTRMDAGSARLTQLLRPLITIARLVGGDYEQHLLNFYRTEIIEIKEDVAMDTLEGKIKYILKSASEEVLGLAKNRWVIEANHIYDKPITADKKAGTFELDTVHIKVLAEELDPSKDYKLPEINKALKRALGKGFNLKRDGVKTRATINDEGLERKLTRYPSTYRIPFNARDFIPKAAEHIIYDQNEEAEESLF
jgi:hypothetical protein